MDGSPATSLVTGAAGQDGTYLCERLLAEGRRVVGVVRPGRGLGLIDGVVRCESDLTTPGAMQALVLEQRPVEVFNLAAESFSPACNDRPLVVSDLMARAVLELLETVRLQAPATRIFQASSSEMFGSPAAAPQDEETPLKPETVYGVAKAFAHQACGLYRRRHGLFVATGILFAHESPRRRHEFLSKKVCRTVARIHAGIERELVLGDLEARRDWSFAGDVADGIRLALRAEVAGDHILASGELHSVREFCELAFARVGRDYRAHVRSDPALVRVDPRTIVGDPARTRALLGWRRSMDFPALVAMMVDHELDTVRKAPGHPD